MAVAIVVAIPNQLTVRESELLRILIPCNALPCGLVRSVSRLGTHVVCGIQQMSPPPPAFLLPQFRDVSDVDRRCDATPLTSPSADKLRH